MGVSGQKLQATLKEGPKTQLKTDFIPL